MNKKGRRLMRWLLTLLLLATPALADDPPMPAPDFEAFVQGRTFDTHNMTGRYGVETFLPGRRAIWRDDAQCLEGTWRVEGDLICFDYQGEPLPFCWTLPLPSLPATLPLPFPEMVPLLAMVSDRVSGLTDVETKSQN